MRKLFTGIVLLLAAQQAFSAAAVVSRHTERVLASSPHSVTLGASLSAGSSVIVVIRAANSSDANAVTAVSIGSDSLSEDTARAIDGASDSWRVWYKHSVTGGSAALSVTSSGVKDYWYAVVEASGLASAAGSDSAETAGTSTTSATLGSGEGLTLSSGDLAVGMLTFTTGDPTVSGADSTVANQISAEWAHALDNVSGTSLALTWTGSNSWRAFGVVYAQESSSPVIPVLHHQLRNQ